MPAIRDLFGKAVSSKSCCAGAMKPRLFAGNARRSAKQYRITGRLVGQRIDPGVEPPSSSFVMIKPCDCN